MYRRETVRIIPEMEIKSMFLIKFCFKFHFPQQYHVSRTGGVVLVASRVD